MKRAASRGKADRMEKRDIGFHHKVREGYLDMAGKDPRRMKIIEAGGEMKEVYEKVKREVYALIKGHKRSA